MEDKYHDLIIGYLQSQLTRKEMDSFYSWVNENDENKKLYFETKAIYDACKSSAGRETIDINESWQRLLLKNKKRKFLGIEFQRFGSYVAVAFFAGLIALSVNYILNPHTEKFTAKYVGGDGIMADKVELPDGTIVTVASNTTFFYDSDYGKKDRVVHLEGEAYFDVAKQKSKPFIVKVKNQSIEALGTKFNVMAYPSDSLLTTTLVEGSVRLTTGNNAKETVLKPNQQLTYNNIRNVIEIANVDASRFTSWTTGYYYFSQQTLKAIFYKLSHVYGITFDVKSEDLNKKIFTGTFYRGQSVNNILEVISLSIPIKYEINDRVVIISE